MHTLFCLAALALSASVPAQQEASAPAVSVAPSPAPAQPFFPSRTVPRNVPWRPLSGPERLDLLVRGSYLKPTSHLRAAFAASIDHLQNDPPQWDNNLHGYRRRFYDRSARFLVRDTLEAGWAAAIGHEVRYIPCNCDGAGRRVWHAFLGGFRTYNRNGEWRPNYARIGAVFGSEYIRYTWRPPADRDASEVATGALMQLTIGVSSRIFREFSPEFKSVFRRIRGK